MTGTKVVPSQLNDAAQKSSRANRRREPRGSNEPVVLGKTDGQRYGKRSGRRLKTVHEPRWMMVQKAYHKGSVYGEIADDVRSRCESGDADHEA